MITKKFHVRIDHNLFLDVETEKMYNTFITEMKTRGIEVDDIETFQGNPACYPYIYATTYTYTNAKVVDRAMRNAIYSSGGAVK